MFRNKIYKIIDLLVSLFSEQCKSKTFSLIVAEYKTSAKWGQRLRYRSLPRVPMWSIVIVVVGAMNLKFKFQTSNALNPKYRTQTKK
jgi:hypothetical protein